VQDKSFVQALQELQDRLASDYEKTLGHMLVHRTTVGEASLHIQDEKVRAVVTHTLLTSQMMALLALMKDLGMLGERHYEECAAYLLQALLSQFYTS